MVRWPSGLRRQTKAYVSNLVRKGVGSNPTLIIYFHPFSNTLVVPNLYSVIEQKAFGRWYADIPGE